MHLCLGFDTGIVHTGAAEVKAELRTAPLDLVILSVVQANTLQVIQIRPGETLEGQLDSDGGGARVSSRSISLETAQTTIADNLAQCAEPDYTQGAFDNSPAVWATCHTSTAGISWGSTVDAAPNCVTRVGG